MHCGMAIFLSIFYEGPKMKIVTWNVNSIRARLESATTWVKSTQPDVVLLQELKCIDENFPSQDFEDLGYNLAIFGQKTYNGVAILSKYPIEDVICGIPNYDDESARYIECVTNGVRVASVYVPNGQSVGSEKYNYKLEFLNHLHNHLKTVLKYEERFVLGGDFNIAPTSDDIKDPSFKDTSILCSPPERQGYQGFLNLGLTDAILTHHAHDIPMTWWDYRSGAFQKDYGLRIDHLLLSPEATDILKNSHVDITPRGWEKPSDHAPVMCELGI